MSISIVSPGTFLSDTTLVVDARSLDRYVAAHVPGALWMEWQGWNEQAPDDAPIVLKQPGYWGVQAASEDLSNRLGWAGLWDDRPIVVYGDGFASKGREGRVAWMLLYLGAPSVALLDGGWEAWLAAGGGVQAGRIPAELGFFTVRRDERRRRTLEDLRRALGSGRLPLMIDTRSPQEYTGEEARYLPRKGHFPNSVFLDYAGLFRENGRFLSREEYDDLLPAEIRSLQDRVAYCEVGVRASLFALLHETYTGELVPVYDGSLVEWGLAGLPVER